MTTRQDALPRRPALAAGARRPRMRGWGERYVQYWLILPALLTMCAVLIYPLAYSLWISFYDWNITSVGRPFLGLRNYVEALTNASSQFIFAQNIAFTVICIALEFVVGMALALLLSRQFIGRGLARTLLLLPMLTAPVLAGFNFRWIFNDRFGLANQLLIQLGLQPYAWLADANLARAVIVLVTIWQGIPFMMLLLLAGLESLPASPFEAAIVDGASAWQRFLHISLPLLRPVIVVAVSLRVIDLFRTFDTIYIITFGGPGHATELLPFYIYRAAFSSGRFGFASALSYIVLVLTLLLLIPLFYRRRERQVAT
ncbi:MAG TPA: sugar ABC transporter permease [Thermomicrobiales bacterium]|jgi:multiple sugar transport system permease protein|nr:sugar ABC transporter permease [Thermomicrobiales bacterium]